MHPIYVWFIICITILSLHYWNIVIHYTPIWCHDTIAIHLVHLCATMHGQLAACLSWLSHVHSHLLRRIVAVYNHMWHCDTTSPCAHLLLHAYYKIQIHTYAYTYIFIYIYMWCSNWACTPIHIYIYMCDTAKPRLLNHWLHLVHDHARSMWARA